MQPLLLQTRIGPIHCPSFALMGLCLLDIQWSQPYTVRKRLQPCLGKGLLTTIRLLVTVTAAVLSWAKTVQMTKHPQVTRHFEEQNISTANKHQPPFMCQLPLWSLVHLIPFLRTKSTCMVRKI